MYFEREDWKLFRNIETLPQKAGVSRDKLPLLIGKELADNALDICGSCEVGFDGGMFFVKDTGPGIDPDQLQEIFCINRPLISSKYLRLPTRGALGNGLRVVTGAVMATGGNLFVSTRGRIFRMLTRDNGSTKAIPVGIYLETGTKISISLGSMGQVDPVWAQLAIDNAKGEDYKGKSSPFWYTSENFFELFHSFKGTVRELVERFDGCTGAKAGRIASEFRTRQADMITFAESEGLLQQLRDSLKPVKPERLGYVGEFEKWSGYYKISGEFNIDSARGIHAAAVPFIIEAWANVSDDISISMFINKSPIVGEVRAYKGKNEIDIYGCGLTHKLLEVKAGEFQVNIICPYVPITTDGKEPNLRPMVEQISEAIRKAAGRAKRKSQTVTGNKEESAARTQKDIVMDCLDAAVDKASGSGQYRFSQRQLYYAVRPYVLDALSVEIEYDYFCSIVTGYEQEQGEIKGMYRDSRGTLYTPHTQERIPIGTMSVEQYHRPELTFNKVIYCEKEGFFEILTDVKFPERFDCALLTSKGFASRAVKDLLDIMGEAEEELLFFCVHDADAYGTKIYETLQEETKARPGRKVKIINLGLDPWEALEMGLDTEKAEGKGKKPVAAYVPDEWSSWLQQNRVELNAMTTPQFIQWLEGKMIEYGNGKVIPDDARLKTELQQDVRTILEGRIRDDILEKAGYAAQVQQAAYKYEIIIDREPADRIRLGVEKDLEEEPAQSWRAPVKEIARELIEQLQP